MGFWTYVFSQEIRKGKTYLGTRETVALMPSPEYWFARAGIPVMRRPEYSKTYSLPSSNFRPEPERPEAAVRPANQGFSPLGNTPGPLIRQPFKLRIESVVKQNCKIRI